MAEAEGAQVPATTLACEASCGLDWVSKVQLNRNTPRNDRS